MTAALDEPSRRPRGGSDGGGVEGSFSAGFSHVSVLVDEVVAWALRVDPAHIADCTLGGGGHARALLRAFPRARLVGIDRDAAAVAAATRTLGSLASRATVVQARFSEVGRLLPPGGTDFLLADLGVSSHQLDTPTRGFSFRAAGPLDMRMNADSGVPVAEALRGVREDELTRIIRTYGEERHARRVARAIVAEPPATTQALAQLVHRVVPKSKDGLDPATRTFQALRIWINGEMDELAALLGTIPDLLAPEGIAVLISFHSLEDRVVKQTFRQQARGCVCPPALPVCGCGQVPRVRLLSPKAVRPQPDEVAGNSRARSARLRVVQRLGTAR